MMTYRFPPRTTGSFLRRLAPAALAVTLLAACGSALAAINIGNNLPYEQNFTTDAYARNLVWITNGATHTWEPNGGWNGSGAARFTPPTTGDGYSGLGSITGMDVQQLNVRLLVYYSDYYAANENRHNKVFLLIPQSGTRPMVFHFNYENWQAFAPCNSTVCKFMNPDPDLQYYASEYDEFRVGDNNYEEQWVCMEFEAVTSTQELNLYITTQDGEFSGLYQTKIGTFSGGLSAIDILGGYFNAGSAAARSDNYFKFSHLKVDDSRIGCPDGFGNADQAAPSPPSNVQITAN